MGKRTNRDPRIQKIKLAAVGVIRVAPRWSDTAGHFVAVEFTKATYKRPDADMRAAVARYDGSVRRLPAYTKTGGGKVDPYANQRHKRGNATVGQQQPALISTATDIPHYGQRAAIKQQSWSDHAMHKAQGSPLFRRVNGELRRVG